MRFHFVLVGIFEKAVILLRETQPEGLNLELNPSSIQIEYANFFFYEKDIALAGLLNSQSHDSSGFAS